mgnify:CR=1 FL=1
MKLRCKEFFKQITFSAKIMHKANGKTFFLYILLRLCIATLPLLELYYFNELIDLLTKGPVVEKVIFVAVKMGICILFLPVLNGIFNVIYRNMNERMLNAYALMLNDKLSKVSMEFLDSNEGRNLMDDVVDARNIVCNFLFKFENVFNHGYIFVVAIAGLVKYKPLFAMIFLLFAIPGAIFKNYSDVLIYSWNLKKAPDVRKHSYYRWMLTDPWPAKDVRMYDLTDNIRERYKQEKAEYLNQKKKLSGKGLGLGILSSSIAYIGIAICLYMLVMEAYNGAISIGEVGWLSGLAFKAMDSFTQICCMCINFFSLSLKRFRRCFEFWEKNEEKDYFENESGQENISFENLEFHNVFFKYPSSKEYILKNINFKFNRGDRVSIVGMNGAGKTTIIKLILGLYVPNKGEIYLNGKSIYEYSLSDVRKVFSAIFQSYVKYPLTIRENVALSDLNNIDNDAGIYNVIEKCGLAGKIKKFKKGLDTYLTRQYDEQGEELSQGQWQKIALARTAFKNSDVVILDEPSAALDPEAEERLFGDYNTMFNEKTSILISHRLSGVKQCNRILVLDKGTIVEQGTHYTLINKGGLYCKLYNLQKNNYKFKEENSEKSRSKL